MPTLAQPAGSEDAELPISLLGSLLKAGIIRYLRANPDILIGAISDGLEVRTSTLLPRLIELEEAGLVIADPPSSLPQSRRGMRVRYRINDEAVTDLYLRLGLAIGEF